MLNVVYNPNISETEHVADGMSADLLCFSCDSLQDFAFGMLCFYSWIIN